MAEGGRVVLLENFLNRKVVPERLGHLLPVDRQESVMNPITRERLAEGPLGLRDFIFMVGKHEIPPTPMYIKRPPQTLGAHGGAFDMPTRPARTPRALPGRPTRLPPVSA